MAVDVLDRPEIGRRNRHQLKVDRQEVLADDVQAGGRQEVVDVGDATGDRVLDRDHGESRLALLDGREGVLEGRAWQRFPTRMHLLASDVRIGARLALE